MTVAAIYVATLAINLFIDEALPEIPARSLMDRELFRYTVSGKRRGRHHPAGDSG